MNPKLAIGRSVSRATNWIAERIPTNRYFPHGWVWYYDVKRYAPGAAIETIFDVGANIGDITLDCTRYFPEAKIYSFEPIAATFQEIAQNTAPFPQIRCFPFALGSKASTATAHVRANTELATLVETTNPWRHDIAQETVTVRTVDDVCDELGISRIDILKMDVQGYEMQVLEGAKRSLTDVTYIFVEAGFQADDPECQYFPPFHDAMQRSGFRLCGLYDQFRWGPEKRWLGFCNALYLNTKALGR